MNIYDIGSIAEKLAGNTYPGRGIILGLTPDGKKAVAAYFIMGRSQNSRNRVFLPEPDGIRTEAHDPALLKDPSLIIYHPVREYGDFLIVTNGDQTDTVRDYLSKGSDFESALRTRCFEPDGPNWTPRISGMTDLRNGNYKLSILKSADPEGSACLRQTFEYAPLPGLGHFLHTYVGDGNPIPSFQGEPERVDVLDDIDAYTELLWKNLNEDNKISLYVRYTALGDGSVEQRIVNKHI
ncbi:MAG: IMP cyclohydrolase [Oscillospiraceae bacterium]|nr:IMP cyclohydrolase [Oscillospiraceae bacterium]